jgi:hypothetical protein
MLAAPDDVFLFLEPKTCAEITLLDSGDTTPWERGTNEGAGRKWKKDIDE